MDMELSILVATANEFNVAVPMSKRWPYILGIAALALVGLCANCQSDGPEAWLTCTVAMRR